MCSPVLDSFRTEKQDLGMRPIFHRKQERAHAHILICFLALTMWWTLQQWMKASGLGTAPRKLLEELRELKSMDVLLPTREKNLRLRMVATPDDELKVLLQRMKIPLPNKPKVIENVVTKMAWFLSQLLNITSLKFYNCGRWARIDGIIQTGDAMYR